MRDVAWRACWAGVVQGTVVYATYCVAEFAFIYIAPFLFEPQDAAFTSWHLIFSGACLLTYITVGGITGGFLGLVAAIIAPRLRLRLPADAVRFVEGALTFTLLFTFALHIRIGRTPGDLATLALALCIILAIAALLRTAGRDRKSWLDAIADPWSVSIILLGVLWWKETLSGSLLRHQALGVFFVIGLLGMRSAMRWIRTSGESAAGGSQPLRDAAFAGAAAVLFVGLAFVLAWTWLPAIPGPEKTPTARGKPDVVLLVMDTVRADRTSLNGYQRDTTPNLRRLAGRATVYRQAISASNYTLPSHASLFTGLHARRHGAHRDIGTPERPLENGFVTLAEILKEHGYLTAAVSANAAYITPRWGMAQGFSVFSSNHSVVASQHYLRRWIQKIFQHSTLPSLNRGYLDARSINNQAFSILNGLKDREEPFFLFVNYMDAHRPLVAPEQFVEPFAAPGHRRLSTARWDAARVEYLDKAGVLTPQEAASLSAEYDGAIAYIDASIGELIGYLQRAGRFDGALFIVTSDHGEAFGEHSMFGHGLSLYQHQVHVPLVVKQPHQSEPHEVAGPVSHVDLMPTILDVLGFDPPKDIDGRTLLGSAESDAAPIFSASLPFNSTLKAARRHARGEHAVYSSGWKLVTLAVGDRELYRLSEDPLEKNNLYSHSSAESARLLSTLDRWFSSTPKYSGEGQLADERMLERLRALGYVH